MTPERWQQIEENFHEALELETAERTKFLREFTGKNSERKKDLEELLSQFDEASSFIEQPVYDSSKHGVSDGSLTRAVGWSV